MHKYVEVQIEDRPPTTKPVIAVDIETTDTLVTAGVWEIAVAALFPDGDGSRLLTYSSLFTPGGTTSGATLEWLKSQPDVYARYRHALSLGVGQKKAVEFLDESLSDIRQKSNVNTLERGACVMLSWGSFDYPILKHMIESRRGLNANDFWNYGNECDLRGVTVFNESGLYPEGVTHKALDDALAVLGLYTRLKTEQQT